MGQRGDRNRTRKSHIHSQSYKHRNYAHCGVLGRSGKPIKQHTHTLFFSVFFFFFLGGALCIIKNYIKGEVFRIRKLGLWTQYGCFICLWCGCRKVAEFHVPLSEGRSERKPWDTFHWAVTLWLRGLLFHPQVFCAQRLYCADKTASADKTSECWLCLLAVCAGYI